MTWWRPVPLLAALMLLLPGAARGQAPGTPGDATRVDTLHLGVLVDQGTPTIREGVRELVAEITAVVGGRVEVVFDESELAVVGFDPDRTRAGYQAMVEGGRDVILALGTGLGGVLAERESFPVPTILLGTVLSDASALPSAGETSGVPNFTFLVTVRSWQSDLAALSDLVDFRRLGIVVPDELRPVLPDPATLDAYLAEVGATGEVVPLDEIDESAERLAGIDAVYLPETLSIGDADIAALADVLMERGIPSFSGSRREDVELGILATNRSAQDRDRVVRRIALHVEAVVEGENLADRPILVDLERRLSLNFQTARAVDLPIRTSLLGEAEILGSFENVQAEVRYTLAGLVEEALAANLGFEVARRDLRLSELDRGQGWSAFLPDVGLDVGTTVLDEALAAASQGSSPQYTTEGSLSVGQLFYSPAAVAGLSILGSQLEGQRESLRASEWDLIREAADAYFSALILKANAEIQLRNLDATNRNLRVAEENYAAGQAGLADVLRLRSQAAREKQSLVAAVTRVRQGFHRINQLVDQPIARDIDVTDVEYTDGNFDDQDFERVRVILDDPRTQGAFQDWAVEEALSRAPELAAYDHALDATRRQARRFGTERFLPTVSGGVAWTDVFDRSGAGAPPAGVLPDRYWTLGVQAAVPLFASNRNRLEGQIAAVQGRRLELERAQLASRIEQATRDAVVSLVQTMTDIELSTISEAAAAEGLALAEEAYATGAINIVDLLDTQANYLQAQLARVSATYTFLNTTVVLQRLTGNFLLLGDDDARQVVLDRFDAFHQARNRQEPAS